MYTAIITLTLPSDHDPGPVTKPYVMIVWPGGQVERFTLAEHDWSNDYWDWRNGHLPTSLLRRLRGWHLAESTVIHGTRVVYNSPANVGIEANETGRLMVYEMDYEH